MIEFVAIEQFYGGISDKTRLWLQNKPTEKNLGKASELTEKYKKMHKKLHGRAAQPEKGQKKEFGPKRPEEKRFPLRKDFRKDQRAQEQPKEGHDRESRAAGISRPSADVSYTFDAQRPIVCYNCQEEGHMARSYRKKMVFRSI